MVIIINIRNDIGGEGWKGGGSRIDIEVEGGSRGREGRGSKQGGKGQQAGSRREVAS